LIETEDEREAVRVLLEGKIMSKVKDYSKTNPKPQFYACLYPDLRQKALECGYALAIHGSMARDMDLIAVAWTDEALEPDVLMEKLLEAAAATIFKNLYPKKGDKPHGRICYTLCILGDWFIDLSVIPPMKSRDEMLTIVNSEVHQTSLRRTAKQIGVSPESLCVALKNKTVSNKVAEYFGYEKKLIYVKNFNER
jgi:hypothetical protein